MTLTQSGSKPLTVTKVTFNKQVKALKVLDKTKKSLQSILKELSIHKSLNNTFIIKYVTHFEDELAYNLIMDYAEYNMRQLIVPEVGLDASVAHCMFAQLVQAVEYLHSKGICHRDIKPDNIMITRNGNIKLGDFGYSTVFRHKEHRRLKSFAGTYAFMAPEVFNGDYDGASADVWSLGLTLLNMITGKLPWAMATNKDEKYKIYISMKYHYYEPFNKLRDSVRDLIEGMLSNEVSRLTLKQIKGNEWYTQTNRLLNSELQCTDSSFLPALHEIETDLHYTQPEIFKAKCGMMNISQPVQQGNVPSIHRFYVTGNLKVAEDAVLRVLKRMNVVCEAQSNFVCFTTTDTKRNVIVGEIALLEINKSTVVTIKKTRGDAHEFKKFLMIFTDYFA